MNENPLMLNENDLAKFDDFEANEERRLLTAFPLFDDCQVRYEYDFDESFVEVKVQSKQEPLVEVLLEGEESAQEQKEAWRLLLGDPANLKKSTLEALRKYGRGVIYRDLQWSSKQLDRYFNPKAFRGMVSLCGIIIHERQPDGHAWVSLNFQVGWDREHGASVLWGAGQIQAVGGHSEFSCRGASVSAAAEYSRRTADR